MNQRSCPSPGATGKRNLSGSVLQRFRREAGLSQAALAANLQRAGWDIDRVVLVRIEAGTRTLLDVELAFLLRILGRTWADLAKSLD